MEDEVALEVGHVERIARMEAEIESIMARMKDQGSAVVELQKLVTTMRLTWASERVKIAMIVAAMGAVFNTLLGVAVVKMLGGMR